MHAYPSPPGLRILVCPSGFKGSLQPQTAADCIEAGILTVLPNATVRKVPLVDGGEGFTKTLVEVTGGTLHPIRVTGPTGVPVESFFGILGPRGPTTCAQTTAVIEMAAAAGLSLVPPHQRNAGATTTYGVGELLRAALDAGADRIVVGCGDSGTCDGGAGMLQALGARLLDGQGHVLPTAQGGDGLAGLAAIDLTGLDRRLQGPGAPSIEAAVSWTNVLCGPRGVARVFGRQKGASTAQIEHLAACMDAVAAAAAPHLGADDAASVGAAAGGGASGGLGTGLRLIGARLRPRYAVVAEYVALDTLFDDCDLVVTAEGGLDDQTPQGKVPAEVAMRAKQAGLPVVALAGTIGPGARANYAVGIDAFASILQRPTTLAEAMDSVEAARLTRESAEGTMRMIGIGSLLATRRRMGAERMMCEAAL